MSSSSSSPQHSCSNSGECSTDPQNASGTSSSPQIEDSPCKLKLLEQELETTLGPSTISTTAIDASLMSLEPSEEKSLGSLSQTEESYLKSIFDNFNDLYRSKIAWIQKTMPDTGDPGVVKAKKEVLESWIADLMAQNTTLIKTVGELEKEAESKVQILQKKVREAASAASEHMSMIQEYEAQIRTLADQKAHLQNEIQHQQEAQQLQVHENNRLAKLNKVLEDDNNGIMTLVHRLRDSGVWNADDLELSTHSYDSIFGQYPSLVGSEIHPVFTLHKALNAEVLDNRLVHLESQVQELDELKTCIKDVLQDEGSSTDKFNNLELLITEYEGRRRKLNAEAPPQHLKYNPSFYEDFEPPPVESPVHTSTVDTDRLEELTKENELLQAQNDELMKKNLDLVNDKAEVIARFEHELEQKDVEITMQKVTITHLQDAYVSLKTGQPYVPSGKSSSTS